MPADSIELNLLFVCSVGLGGSVLGLLGLLLGPKRGWTITGFVFALLLFGGSLAGAALRLRVELCAALVAMGGLALVFAAVRCSWLHRAAGWLLQHLQRPRFQGLVLLLLCPAFIVWWAHQTDQQIAVVDDHTFAPPLELDPSQLREVDTVRAATDQGRAVRLYTLPQDLLSAAERQQLELDMVRNRDLAQKQIRTAAPDNNYNCHGWVFAAGQFWVRGAEVPQILEDNGYRAVSEPRPGDVIVYKDDARTVLHTGLVRTVTEDGLILIESKWGWMGRYIHRPEDQTYGDNWTFYRSEREVHRLRGVGGETPQVAGLKD